MQRVEVENLCVKNSLFHFILNLNIKFWRFEKMKVRMLESENARIVKINALFSDLPIEIIKIYQREILSRQNPKN